MVMSFSHVLYSVFFFKQKTAYEMRISDWSSDVCSSDLRVCGHRTKERGQRFDGRLGDRVAGVRTIETERQNALADLSDIGLLALQHDRCLAQNGSQVKT